MSALDMMGSTSNSTRDHASKLADFLTNLLDSDGDRNTEGKPGRGRKNYNTDVHKRPSDQDTP